MDMERIDVGKTSEDCGQHLAIIADSKTDMEVQDRDSWQPDTWVHHCPSLQCKKSNPNAHSTTQLLRGENTLASNIAQARRPMNQRRAMQSKHLDDVVADLQLVLSQLNFSKHVQRWGMYNLDLAARILICPEPQKEPLEAPGVYYCDAVYSGPVDLHAPETVADDAETQRG